MFDPRLEKIHTIKAEDLANLDVFTQINSAANEYINGFYVGESLELWLVLSQLLKGKILSDMPVELADKYKSILLKLAWTCISVLPQGEAEELFKSQLLLGLSLEIDLINGVKGFTEYPYGEETGQEKKRKLVLASLKDNEEQFGNRNLKIEGVTGDFKPLIKNWLKDYDQSTETEKRKGRLSFLEYINTSKNVRQLDNSQKDILKQILEVYDFLRFTVTAPEVPLTGHQLPSQQIGISSATPFLPTESLALEKVESSAQQDIIKAYQGDPKAQSAIAKAEEKLVKLVKEDKGRLRAEFFAAVQKKDVNMTIAAFRLLAQKDDISNFLQEDVKLNKFLTSVWVKQYGADFVKEFNQNPGELKFVRLFLRYVLQDRLGLAQNDAARVGLQIGNILVNLGKKGYNKMAYFDIKKKQFEWLE
ncbi:MAG: hypothetical protein WC508_02215 [Patescibacteria group bacterium]